MLLYKTMYRCWIGGMFVAILLLMQQPELGFWIFGFAALGMGIMWSFKCPHCGKSLLKPRSLEMTTGDSRAGLINPPGTCWQCGKKIADKQPVISVRDLAPPAG